MRDLVAGGESEESPTAAKVITALKEAGKVCGGADNPFQRIATRLTESNQGDSIEVLTAAVCGKSPVSLTDEDFGKASGIIESAAAIRKQEELHRASGNYIIILPSGERRTLMSHSEETSKKQIAAEVSRWRAELSLTVDQLAFSVLCSLFTEPTSDITTESFVERVLPDTTLSPLDSSPDRP